MRPRNLGDGGSTGGQEGHELSAWLTVSSGGEEKGGAARGDGRIRYICDRCNAFHGSAHRAASYWLVVIKRQLHLQCRCSTRRCMATIRRGSVGYWQQCFAPRRAPSQSCWHWARLSRSSGDPPIPSEEVRPQSDIPGHAEVLRIDSVERRWQRAHVCGGRLSEIWPLIWLIQRIASLLGAGRP